jgi:hypothetical protein
MSKAAHPVEAQAPCCSPLGLARPSAPADNWIDNHLPPALLESSASRPAQKSTRLGYCVREHHPIFEGRVFVRYELDGSETNDWLVCLMGVRPQAGDRLLLNFVSGLDQWVVCGILDGFRERLSAARPNPTLALEPGQAITLVNLRGQSLAHLSLLEDGLAVQSLGEEMAVGTSGTLRLFGDEVKIESTSGNVEVASANDAVIRGQFVRLN